MGDLVVGAPGCDDGGQDRGAVWVLFLAPGGAIAGSQKISASTVAVPGLDVDGAFGSALAKLGPPSGAGDLNQDGLPDIAVGAPAAAGGGAAWVLFLGHDGVPLAAKRVPENAGDFADSTGGPGELGSALACLGPDPANPDQVILAVGAPGTQDWTVGQGGYWNLSLGPDGSCLESMRVSATRGGFSGFLERASRFGSALATGPDLDDNGLPDLFVGAPGTGADGSEEGAAWAVFTSEEFVARVEPFGESGGLAHGPPAVLVIEDDPVPGGACNATLDWPDAPPGEAGTVCLYVSWKPHDLAPEGALLPGYTGNLLVPHTQSTVYHESGWTAAGGPIQIATTIPLEASLLGTSLFVQGGIHLEDGVMLSNGLRLVLGLQTE